MNAQKDSRERRGKNTVLKKRCHRSGTVPRWGTSLRNDQPSRTQWSDTSLSKKNNQLTGNHTTANTSYGLTEQ
jgi:hypothetical protein